jgi:hypothetical protein
MSTMNIEQDDVCAEVKSHTCSSRPHCNVQRSNKIREDCVHLIQPCNNIYDIGTGVGVFLG